jgi:hypothetical protein
MSEFEFSSSTPIWIFAADCYPDNGVAIDTLAALRCLSDDCSGFKVAITPIRQNTDGEIRIPQLDPRCLVIQPYDQGNRCLWRP